MANAIELHHIYKTFGTQEVLKDLSLEIEENSFTVIAGPSGCGKSTLLNLLGLLDHPDKGEIDLFEHKNIKAYSKQAKKELRDTIGYLFQNFALIDDKTAEYNLSIALDSKTNNNRKEKMIDALIQVGLDESYLKKYIYQCSGGEQQRIAIARLLLKPCKLILADEPTGSLDEDNKILIYKLLRNLQATGKTIVIVTHDQQLMEQADFKIELNKNYE